MNRRYALQQSIFISLDNSEQTLMDQLEFLGDNINKSIVKILLPATLKKEVLKDLQKMNITRMTLFPDLDGYAVGHKMNYDLVLSFKEDILSQYNSFKENKEKLFP